MEVRVRGRVPVRRVGSATAGPWAGSGCRTAGRHGATVRPRGNPALPPCGTARGGAGIPTVQLVPETGLSSIPAGWLLLELPTALLVAVFVGTGWLGYAGTDRPIPDPPLTVVVAPGDPDSLSITFGDN
ncbi:hypothetical protein [Nocardia veterana]|nr:hypothetical protein [Nocardia veterana]